MPTLFRMIHYQLCDPCNNYEYLIMPHSFAKYTTDEYHVHLETIVIGPSQLKQIKKDFFLWKTLIFFNFGPELMENHPPPRCPLPPEPPASICLSSSFPTCCILLSNLKGPESSDCIFFLTANIGAQEGKQGWIRESSTACQGFDSEDAAFWNFWSVADVKMMTRQILLSIFFKLYFLL